MPFILDFVWIPSKTKPTPPVGQGPAIYRADDFIHSFVFWSDANKTVPATLPGGATYSAQFRPQRLGAGVADAALADLVVTVDLVTATITMKLVHGSVRDLPETGFWDLQQNASGVLTTLGTGKFKMFDDVTRP